MERLRKTKAIPTLLTYTCPYCERDVTYWRSNDFVPAVATVRCRHCRKMAVVHPERDSAYLREINKSVKMDDAALKQLVHDVAEYAAEARKAVRYKLTPERLELARTRLVAAGDRAARALAEIEARLRKAAD